MPKLEVVTLPTQFAFRLIGGTAPDGEIDADHLLELVAGLKDVANRFGRMETESESIGRTPARAAAMSQLLITLTPGSTNVKFRRAVDVGNLDFDTPAERAFDQKLAEWVECIASNQRPQWADEGISKATRRMVAALQESAREVEFTADDSTRARFIMHEIRAETWGQAMAHAPHDIEFQGVLFAANLKTHRFMARDDVGTEVSLPAVTDDRTAARLLDQRVSIQGTAIRNNIGMLTAIEDAVITAADADRFGVGVPHNVSVDDLLNAAPGIGPGEGLDLTDEEFAAFREAVAR